MAIEFNCPYCTATLRVPDSAMGKEGSCPKCESALTVPVIERPKPKQDFPVEVVTPTTRLSEAAPPPVPTPPPTQPDSQSEFDFLDPAPPSTTPNPQSQVSVEPTSPGPIITEPARPSVARKLKKYRKSGSFATVVPILFVAVLVGGGYWLYDTLQPKFSGNVTATQVEASKIPSVLFGKTRIEGKQVEVLEMLSALELNPANYLSDLMEVRLVGTRRALSVELQPGTETEFFRVNLMKFPAVKQFYVDHATKLDRPRIELLDQTLAEFKKDVLAGKDVNSQENILNYRDNLALSITVGALGYHVEAIAEGKRYRCVFQDEENRLYFLLPTDTKQFTVVPRQKNDDAGPLPESFHFEVTEVKKAKSSEPAAKSQDDSSETTTEDNDKNMGEGEAESGNMKPEGEMDGESMSPGNNGSMKPTGEMQPGEMKPEMMQPPGN